MASPAPGPYSVWRTIASGSHQPPFQPLTGGFTVGHLKRHLPMNGFLWNPRKCIFCQPRGTYFPQFLLLQHHRNFPDIYSESYSYTVQQSLETVLVPMEQSWVFYFSLRGWKALPNPCLCRCHTLENYFICYYTVPHYTNPLLQLMILSLY